VYRNASAGIFEKISAKVDESENEILKNHPLKKYIINSREALNLSQEVVHAAYDLRGFSDVFFENVLAFLFPKV
jgi:hypothetical protein